MVRLLQMQRASRVSVICCGKTLTVTFEIFAAQRLHAKSGLNTQVIFFWACAPWRLRIQPSKIHAILSRQTDRRRRDKKAFCFSASARGRPCSDLSRALRAVHGAQTAKIP